jgi:hypothetical protein
MLGVSLGATLCANVFIHGVAFLIPMLHARHRPGRGRSAGIGSPFSTIPELAGPFWSGRALSAQNAMERLMVALGPAVFGGLISAAGFPVAFAVCALFPLAALPLVPVGPPPRATADIPPERAAAVES